MSIKNYFPVTKALIPETAGQSKGLLVQMIKTENKEIRRGFPFIAIIIGGLWIICDNQT